jgi:hypothetical protein
VVARLGTVALINVSFTTVNVALIPLNVTLVVPARPFPKIAIGRPTLMYRKLKNPFPLAFRCVDSAGVWKCFGVEAGKLRTGRFLRTKRMS